MFYVYILWSEKWSKYYVGQTADIDKRIMLHNEGRVKSTKGGVPWVVKYKIEVVDQKSTVLLEKKIKKQGVKDI